MKIFQPGLNVATAGVESVVDMYSAVKSGEVKLGKGGASFDKKSVVATSMEVQRPIDFQDQIRYASKAYNISDDARDYCVVPVPIMISDVPNRNGIAFPAKALAAFSVEHGKPFFKTWQGKPTFEEHDNQDPLKAKGMIFDVVMNPVHTRPGFYKVMALLGFDRTKDRLCYEKIVSGRSNAYSMGAYPGYYQCSICGNTHQPGERAKCNHVVSGKVNFHATPDNRLVYLSIWENVGFEISRVDTPAYRMAVSDLVNVLDPELVTRKT